MNDRTEYVCTECDWSVCIREEGEGDASRLAIEHYLESGHSVAREDEPDPRGQQPLWSTRR
ncbi:UBP-type zinc finger domain-containing protein [Halalkalicoccus ordinarius]|uniref:UBP-type zinc finger domain-containing protein n=1 Tax=Halalkalicoccus ordinarius TaxID=3116651 RepID=UPI00300ECB91